MSDTPRTDAEYARLKAIYDSYPRSQMCCAFENDMTLCRQLERELNQAIKERDEWMLKAAKAIRQHDDALKDVASNKAGWDNASLVALRLERERNEAQECLRYAVELHTDYDAASVSNLTLNRWRKAARL